MVRKLLFFGLLAVTVLALAAPALARNSAHARGEPGQVYVTSQGLYYDTYGVAFDLPNKGPFQQLVDGTTEFGPGDPGYLGGRWWVDSNNNGFRDDGDTFFLCPLLPPGH
jgi:hypothetical protein